MMISQNATPYNLLSAAQAERLAVLIEECGEVIKAASKVLRHGYYDAGYNNRAHLEAELGDVLYALELMVADGDLSEAEINAKLDANMVAKAAGNKYLHHN